MIRDQLDGPTRKPPECGEPGTSVTGVDSDMRPLGARGRSAPPPGDAEAGVVALLRMKPLLWDAGHYSGHLRTGLLGPADQTGVWEGQALAMVSYLRVGSVVAFPR